MGCPAHPAAEPCGGGRAISFPAKRSNPALSATIPSDIPDILESASIFEGRFICVDTLLEPLPAGVPTLKVPAGPQNVNIAGDVFGGWLMSQVDIAGAVRAMERARGRVATVAVNAFRFFKPVKVSDLVLCYADIVRVGRTSITVDVVVYVERRVPPEFTACTLKVAQATLVYVALDRDGNGRVVPPDPSASTAVEEEVFAVVDERDNVIGHRPRSEIHHLQLRHRAAHIMVFNGRGELLLQKRSLHKESDPGRWDSSAAGHVDREESYDACAVRELAEELGLRVVAPLERLFKIDACADTGWEFVWVYRCRADGPFAFNRAEMDAVAWFSRESLEQGLAERPHEFSSTLPLIWQRLSGLS